MHQGLELDDQRNSIQGVWVMSHRQKVGVYDFESGQHIILLVTS
jgi:hypothetical protein